MTDLTFYHLKISNIARCEESYHPISSWSLTDWATALAGEVGEACNVIKKLRRLDIRTGPVRSEDIEEEAYLWPTLADALADVQIYLDLLATAARIDLQAAVIAKFNRTSDRVGSSVRL